MKGKAALSLLPFLLSGCAAESPEYRNFVEIGEDGIRIIQLADCHWGMYSDLRREKAYLSALIDFSDADMAILTGDQVLLADKKTYRELLDTLEESDLSHFALAWGNHDEQGLYPFSYPTDLALSYPKCLNKDNPGDDVFGASNFVIDLAYLGKRVHSLYVLDSNKLSPSGLSLPYDVIHQDQIDWYAEMVEEQRREDGYRVPQSLFFHIGLWQYEYAYRLRGHLGEYSEDPSCPGTLFDYSGDMGEESWEVPGLGETRVYCGYEDSGLFEKASELGAKAMFVGHDHKNDFCALYSASSDPDEAIALCYGLKSGEGLTYLEGHLGANIIDINSRGEITGLNRLYLDYEDDNDYSGASYRFESIFQSLVSEGQ